MFVTYALAIGLALACVGLYQEVATHRRWSRLSKWWGSLAVGVAMFGAVPLVVGLVSHVALIATCSCALLALSLHSQHPVEDTIVEIAEASPAVEGEVVHEIVIEQVAELGEESADWEPEVTVEPAEEVVAVSAESLNAMIAEGYLAKSSGDYVSAVQAFQRAKISCDEAGLSAMLNEELTDCYDKLRSQEEPFAPAASELKQGA